MLDLLFVYGTLRRSFTNRYADFLRERSELVGCGTIPGRLLLLGSERDFVYPGALLEVESARQILGEVVRLHEPELAFPFLDAYEGVGEGFPEPQEYVRKMVGVSLGDGRSVECWCYLFNRLAPGLREIPSGDFAAFQREGTS